MKVVIKDHETGNLMHGDTRLSPEEFREAFRRGYNTNQFSYRIIFADVTRNGKHRCFKSALGLDPLVVADWIRSTVGEALTPAYRLAA